MAICNDKDGSHLLAPLLDSPFPVGVNNGAVLPTRGQTVRKLKYIKHMYSFFLCKLNAHSAGGIFRESPSGEYQPVESAIRDKEK